MGKKKARAKRKKAAEKPRAIEIPLIPTTYLEGKLTPAAARCARWTASSAPLRPGVTPL